VELTQENYSQVIANLLQQNAELRLEFAVLRHQAEELSKELDIQRQMIQSTNIPPDVLEMLSKLDIR